MSDLYQKRFFFREARPGDGTRLAACLRTQDRAELELSHPGESVEKWLEFFIKKSVFSFFISYRGEAAALMGVCPDSFCAQRACVWLLTGKVVTKSPIRFVKICRFLLQKMLDFYPELENWVDERYPRAPKFLKSLGGRFDGKYRRFGPVRFFHVVFRRF